MRPLSPNEIWYTLEDPHPQHGVSLWDARKGTVIFGVDEPVQDNQVAGGLAGDIDPAYPVTASTPRRSRRPIAASA